MRWLALLGLAACADPVIEMRLVLPGDDAARGFDLSCTGAVAVRLVGKHTGDGPDSSDALQSCVDLVSAPHSFADVQRALGGQFSLSLPTSGLAGVELNGFQGRCSDPADSREAVFYGAALHDDGSDTLTIPLVPNLSCGPPKQYAVRVLDMVGLTVTHRCTTPLDGKSVFASNIRPRLLGDRAPRMTLERGAPAFSSDGTGTVAFHAAAVDQRACIALGYEGELDGGLGCVNADAETLCADDDLGEREIASFPREVVEASTDPMLVKQYGEPVFGAVWELGWDDDELPLAGATVELADPSQGKVVYVEIVWSLWTVVKLRPIAKPSTADHGLFIAYIRGEATNLNVKAPGYLPRGMKVASVPGWPSSTLVVALRPM